MSRFPSSQKSKRYLSRLTIAHIDPLKIRRWAIALIFTVSFNPVAIDTVSGQTDSSPQNPATSQESLIAQIIAQQDYEPKPGPAATETSTPETESKSKRKPAAKEPSSLLTGKSWQTILPPVLAPTQNSAIVFEPVRLDGRTIFSVASSTKDRVEIIERHLRTVLHSNFDPKTLKVYYQILNSLPVIYVSWENHPEPIYILTVTNADAQSQGVDLVTLANRWTEEIKQILRLAYQERQPAALKQQVTQAGIVILIVILSSGSLISIRQRLQKKHEQILAEIPPEPEANAIAVNAEIADRPNNFPEYPEDLEALLQKRVTLLQKLNFNEIEHSLVPVGQVGTWGVGTYIALGIFPYTRWLQPVITSILPIPIQLTVTIVSTYVAIRLSGIVINRFFAVLEKRNFQLAGTSEQRQNLRFSTFSRVFRNLSSGLMISVGILVSLSAIGINIAPLLAGAGILGLGISLGSQNLIKDTINGFFILLEDQYAVGDVIVIGDVGGLVENMNLRITQLRNGEGRLITIPNSAITVVQNLSKDWARVDLTLDVSYQSDVDRALATIQEVVDEIYQDTEWREKIIAPPEVLGIDRMDHAGIMIRVWIRVKPLQHWSVGRECRRRLKKRLDVVGISIGTPQQTLLFNNSLELLSLKNNNSAL